VIGGKLANQPYHVKVDSLTNEKRWLARTGNGFLERQPHPRYQLAFDL